MNIKSFLNSARNLLIFRLRYPWIKYGRNVHVQWSTTFWSPHRKIVLGNNVGIGGRCEINTDLTIGNDVLIASNVALVARDAHRYDIPGTSIFQSPRGDKHEIVIEDDVWIGFGAIILSGLRIGRGSIVAAGSVVIADVPRYSIFVPGAGHVHRSRFSPEQIQLHEQGLLRKGVLSSSFSSSPRSANPSALQVTEP